MSCLSEGNHIIYSSDSTVCKTTYNYSTHSGMNVLAKTIVIGDDIPTPETMCISYGHWKQLINCCDVMSRLYVNGNLILANYASNAYETPSIAYSLQTGDVVSLYVNSFYTSARSCVNNFRISRFNTAPTANAGGFYNGSTNKAVLFDGSGSTDPDGTIVLYEWDFGDGETGTGETVEHSYAVEGTYTVELTTTDDGGLTDVGTTTATISPAEATNPGRPSHRSTGATIPGATICGMGKRRAGKRRR